MFVNNINHKNSTNVIQMKPVTVVLVDNMKRVTKTE